MKMASESRPAGKQGGLHHTQNCASSLPPAGADEALRRTDQMLVLLVHVPGTESYRRRLYLSLPAAERAARRARERGHVAHVVLGSFSPAGVTS